MQLSSGGASFDMRGPPHAHMAPLPGDSEAELLRKCRLLRLLHQAYSLRLEACMPAAEPYEGDGVDPCALPPPHQPSRPPLAALPSGANRAPQLGQQEANKGGVLEPLPAGGGLNALWQQQPNPLDLWQPQQQQDQRQEQQQEGIAAAATAAVPGGPAPPTASAAGAGPLAPGAQQPPVVVAATPAGTLPAPTPRGPVITEETPIGALAVRLFHDPPTTGQRPGPGRVPGVAGGRRRSSCGAPLSRPSPLQQQNHQQQQLYNPQYPPQQQQQQLSEPSDLESAQQQLQPGPWINTRRPAAMQPPSAAQQPEARPRQLHLTRPTAVQPAWDAQSQALGADGGWCEQPPAGPWARVESQCGATWSPPCAGGPGSAARPSPFGVSGEGLSGADLVGPSPAVPPQEQQQQQQAGGPPSPLPLSLAQEQELSCGGTQPPPGWEGSQPQQQQQQQQHVMQSVDDDADVVPPTPVRLGDTADEASIAVPGTTGTASRGALASLPRAGDAGGMQAAATLPLLRKRRLPSLGGGGTPVGGTPLAAPGQVQEQSWGRAPSSAGRSGGASGGSRAWQPRGLPAAGPSAHRSVPLLPPALDAAAASAERLPRGQLRIGVGAPVRRLLPFGRGGCGVLLERPSTGRLSGRGSRPRTSLGASASKASPCSFNLLIISRQQQQQQQQQQRGTEDGGSSGGSGGGLAAIEARGMWEVRAHRSSNAAAADGSGGLHGLQLLYTPAAGTLLAAVPSFRCVCDGATSDSGPQLTETGVNVWRLSDGGGGDVGGGNAGSRAASAKLLQALPTPERMLCLAVGGGSWLAAAGDAGRAYVWPLQQHSQEQQQIQHQQRQQRRRQQQVAKEAGWRHLNGVEDDPFFDDPTHQQQQDEATRAAAAAAAAPIDVDGRVALPAATLRGMPFTELAELCFLPPAAGVRQSSSHSSGWLLAGCSAAGALALWDVSRCQLLVSAFPSLGGLSQLTPLAQPPPRGAVGPLPVVLLARIPSPDDGNAAGNTATGITHPHCMTAVLLHEGGAELSGSALPLHMPVTTAAVAGSIVAAAAANGGLAAWDALSGRCLLRGALPSPGRSRLGAVAGAAAAGESACVGFLSSDVLVVGTQEGSLHIITL